MSTMFATGLELTDEEREALEAMARSSSLPHRSVVQARGLLLAAEGVGNNEIARRCDVQPNAVRRWRSKFAVDGVAGVGRIRPGRGRKPEVPDEVIEAIVHDTLHTTPPNATHWSTRSMADHVGVGKDTVARIWRTREIRPHRVETFKVSNDPQFEEKLVDVVGLYLNPPERADALFTTDRPVIFDFHGYPWLVHRLTYKRHGHDNLHVRGFIDEGTTTTPFDMCVRNRIDRYHLVIDVIDRVPALGAAVGHLRDDMVDQLTAHREHVTRVGDDLPEIRDWNWPRP